VPRRVNLPAADDLFRRTGEDPPKVRAVPDAPEAEEETAPAAKRGPSGRVKHDEKMTVYVTSDELLEIEHARLALRSGPGLAVDRGRLVRVAISLALADFEANGEASELVRRLTEE
jgi:hypothetical protein